MTNAVGWMLPKAPLLPQAGQPASERGPTLTSTSFESEPPEIQARLLTTISNHYAPNEYIPQIKSLASTATHAWPKFVAACITPSPCEQLRITEQVLRQVKTTDEDATELKPEPSRGMTYKPPPAGYKTKLRVVQQPRRTTSTAPVVPASVRRTAAVNEFVRLGTGMQPSLSRRKSSITKKSLPRVGSMFLSGRKSEKARAAEEKARAEEEKAKAAEKKAREEQEKEEREREESVYSDVDYSDVDYSDVVDSDVVDSDLDLIVAEKARVEEEKAKAAEKKAREEQEKEEREREEREAETEMTAGASFIDMAGNTENGGNNGDEIQRNEYVDFSDNSDLDVTVRDAAEIERTEGMDENMIQSQRDKEARPRHVGEIVKKMHGRNAGPRNIVAEETDLPAPTDTGYARQRRKEEAAKKRLEHKEAAMEKEKQMMEQRRIRFIRKRKRKLQKAGKFVRTDSDDDQTSVAPEEDSATAENSVHVTDPYSRDTEPRDAQRRRIDPPNRYEDGREADGRYRGRPQEGGHRYDDPGRYDYPQPPPDARRYGERPPQWQHTAFPYHPSATPPSYGPPSYYAPPSPYFGYHPSPYYPHHSPPPPHQQFYPPRAPPRLSREEFEKKRKDLYDKIGSMCNDLHTDDARAIDDFLDNQDHMFRSNEKTKYYLLEQTAREEVLLRIDREKHGWEVVRKRVSS